MLDVSVGNSRRCQLSYKTLILYYIYYNVITIIWFNGLKAFSRVSARLFPLLGQLRVCLFFLVVLSHYRWLKTWSIAWRKWSWHVIAISEEGRKEEIDSCSQSLIGKFLTCKPFNKKVTHSTLRRAWCMEGGVPIVEVGSNLF